MAKRVLKAICSFLAASTWVLTLPRSIGRKTLRSHLLLIQVKGKDRNQTEKILSVYLKTEYHFMYKYTYIYIKYTY